MISWDKLTKKAFTYQYFLKPLTHRLLSRQVSTRLLPGIMPGSQGRSPFIASICIQKPQARIGGNVYVNCKMKREPTRVMSALRAGMPVAIT